MVNSKKVFSGLFGAIAVVSYGAFFYFKSQEKTEDGMQPETKANIAFYLFLLSIILATGMGIAYKGKSELSRQDYINVFIAFLAVGWLLYNKLFGDSSLGKVDIGMIGLIGLLSGESLVVENF